jgi:hypothetical protein
MVIVAVVVAVRCVVLVGGKPQRRVLVMMLV